MVRFEIELNSLVLSDPVAHVEVGADVPLPV